MQDKMYNEVEKNSHIAQAISANNSIFFDLIKEHIDGLITERLIAFRSGIPSISQSNEQNQYSTDRCME